MDHSVRLIGDLVAAAGAGAGEPDRLSLPAGDGEGVFQIGGHQGGHPIDPSMRLEPSDARDSDQGHQAEYDECEADLDEAEARARAEVEPELGVHDGSPVGRPRASRPLTRKTLSRMAFQ